MLTLIADRKEEIYDLTAKILNCDGLYSDLYKQTDPVLLCGFYFRYWLVINRLKNEKPELTMGVPEKDDDFINMLLFNYIEV